jgi:prepilin-type processing-associated H-X9-DG protein
MRNVRIKTSSGVKTAKDYMRLNKFNLPPLAFGRLELFFLIIALAALTLVTLPRPANARTRSQRMTCLDNLHQVGQGFQLWVFEHQDFYPWTLPVTGGGTRPTTGTKPGNVYRELSMLSNSLATPKVLVCPIDDRKALRTADNWGNTQNGGFLHPSYGNNATSYTIGLHADLSAPDSLVSSDRFLRVDITAAGCSVGVNNAAGVISSGGSLVAWTNRLHGQIGNVLFADGRVDEVVNSKVQRAIIGPGDFDNFTAHLLLP